MNEENVFFASILWKATQRLKNFTHHFQLVQNCCLKIHIQVNVWVTMLDNGTLCEADLKFYTISHVVTVILLLMVNAVVIIGNLMVVVTVIFSRRLRTTNSNMLILSLACSDLFLGLIVLPFSAANQTMGTWIFGPYMCRIWLASDVWMCTASIYNLVIITVDRFIAVTKPLSYKTIVTTKKILLMVATAWFLSFFTGIPLVFMERREMSSDCYCNHMVNNPSYIVISSFVSFYIPFSIIIYFYFRIYRRIRGVSSALTHGFIDVQTENNLQPKKASLRPTIGNGNESSPLLSRGNRLSINLRIHRGGYRSSESSTDNIPVRKLQSDSTSTICTSYQPKQLPIRPRSQTWELHTGSKSILKIRHAGSMDDDNRPHVCECHMHSSRLPSFGRRYEMNITRYQKRLAFELKALKTVGVVTGCFIICWFGFCLIYAMQALQNYNVSDTLASVTSWLGYANSGINPFIYAACNRQYRRSFQNLIFRGSHSKYPPRSSSFSVSAVSQSRRQSCLIETSFELMATKNGSML